MTEVAVNEALGELLSPSHATTYLACPAKWYFRYLIGLSEPTTRSQWARHFTGHRHGTSVRS